MVGTTIVELENISGSIVLDCALQEAYQGSTLMNDHMTGEFPVLKPGANAISWAGSAEAGSECHQLGRNGDKGGHPAKLAISIMSLTKQI